MARDLMTVLRRMLGLAEGGQAEGNREREAIKTRLNGQDMRHDRQSKRIDVLQAQVDAHIADSVNDER